MQRFFLFSPSSPFNCFCSNNFFFAGCFSDLKITLGFSACFQWGAWSFWKYLIPFCCGVPFLIRLFLGYLHRQSDSGVGLQPGSVNPFPLRWSISVWDPGSGKSGMCIFIWVTMCFRDCSLTFLYLLCYPQDKPSHVLLSSSASFKLCGDRCSLGFYLWEAF